MSNCLYSCYAGGDSIHAYMLKCVTMPSRAAMHGHLYPEIYIILLYITFLLFPLNISLTASCWLFYFSMLGALSRLWISFWVVKGQNKISIIKGGVRYDRGENYWSKTNDSYYIPLASDWFRKWHVMQFDKRDMKECLLGDILRSSACPWKRDTQKYSLFWPLEVVGFGQ